MIWGDGMIHISINPSSVRIQCAKDLTQMMGVELGFKRAERSFTANEHALGSGNTTMLAGVANRDV